MGNSIEKLGNSIKTIMAVIAIAHNTLRETIWDHILQTIAGLLLLVILASKMIGEISLGQDLKIICDLSLGAMDLFGVVLCIYLGAVLLPKEMDRRTLYSVLTTPITRWQFLLGKYMGITASIGLSFFIMGTGFCLFFWFQGGNLNWIIPGAIFLLLLGTLLLHAIGLLLATIISPMANVVFTVLIFIIGRSSYELKYWAEQLNGVGKYLLQILYYLLPNFSIFNIKMAAVHNNWKAVHNRPVDSDIFYWAILYWAIYTIFVLYLACLSFEKRDL